MKRLTLEQLNVLPPAKAARALLSCCGSRAWARDLTARRPFYNFEELVQAADRVWERLTPDDWLEAFSAHPRIGEKAASVTTTAEHWSENEQARARGGTATALADLAAINAEYERRFGYVFLICATGKSAEDILANARSRLHNDPEQELHVAAREQRLITHLRLRKLMDV
jgi:OHCU decarboxylase